MAEQIHFVAMMYPDPEKVDRVGESFYIHKISAYN